MNPQENYPLTHADREESMIGKLSKTSLRAIAAGLPGKRPASSTKEAQSYA